MAIANDMKRLGEDIIASYEARVKAIGELARDVRKTLEGFEADRKKMAQDLRESFEEDEAVRLKDFKDMMGNIQRGIKEIENGTKELLRSFEDERKKMAANWQALAATMAEKRGVKSISAG